MGLIKFECDKVRRIGIVGIEISCCQQCHEEDYDAPFILVDHERLSVCCAVASAYNIEQERRENGRKHG